MNFSGKHQQKAVTLKYDSSVIAELKARAGRILEKAIEKGNHEVIRRQTDFLNKYDEILEEPELLNDPEYAAQKQAYIDNVCFSEKGWKSMFEQS